MADYSIPDYVTSRVRFYNGQFLREDDFIDEQRYQVAERRRHERTLHGPGVVEGLDVTLTGSVVTVAPGSAIDVHGRPIVLLTAQSLSAGGNGTYYVEISFNELESRPSDQNSAVSGNTRFTQSTQPVAIVSSRTADGLLLAQLTVAPSGVTLVKTNQRLYSGPRLPAPGGGYVLRAKGDTSPGWVELPCSLSVTGDTAVAGNTGLGAASSGARLGVTAAGANPLGGTALSPALQVSAGQLGQAAGNELAVASLGGWAASNATVLGVRAVRTAAGTDWNSTAICLGMDVDATVRAGASLWLSANGGVGVGAAPAAGNKLDVAGNLNYGQLTKLDTIESGVAYLRVYDFRIGSASRKGTTGRALVDGATELLINCASDWANTHVQSPLTVDGMLTVASATANADVALNSKTRPSIYPAGSNAPANLGMQVRSAGTGDLQLNNDNAGNVLLAIGGGNVGVGAVPGARLGVTATGANPLGGTALSPALLVSAGQLGAVAGNELAVASLGGWAASNATVLGVRAVRTAAGTDWNSTAICLGMDVDATVRAGASLWLSANGGVGVGAAPAAGNKLDVAGNLNYGQLTKLDVVDNFTAYIRCADFRIGYSARRGTTTGRALVDGATELVINCGPDWATTHVQSPLRVDGTVTAPSITFNDGSVQSTAVKIAAGTWAAGAMKGVQSATITLQASAYGLTKITGASAAISMLDCEHGFNTRMNVTSAIAGDAKSCTLTAGCWADTIIYNVNVAWIIYGY
jgi:hypothetical protein